MQQKQAESNTPHRISSISSRIQYFLFLPLYLSNILEAFAFLVISQILRKTYRSYRSELNIFIYFRSFQTVVWLSKDLVAEGEISKNAPRGLLNMRWAEGEGAILVCQIRVAVLRDDRLVEKEE